MGLRRRIAVLVALLAASPALAWKVDVASSGAAHAVATTADGDVIAGGLFDTSTGKEIVVVRLAASGDSERWRTEIRNTVNATAQVLPGVCWLSELSNVTKNGARKLQATTER